MLTEASAGAPVAAHVTGNGEHPDLFFRKSPALGFEPAGFAICSQRANHDTPRASSSQRPAKAHYIRLV
eukprot:6858801-Prymnesium_polylepis.1